MTKRQAKKRRLRRVAEKRELADSANSLLDALKMLDPRRILATMKTVGYPAAEVQVFASLQAGRQPNIECQILCAQCGTTVTCSMAVIHGSTAWFITKVAYTIDGKYRAYRNDCSCDQLSRYPDLDPIKPLSR